MPTLIRKNGDAFWFITTFDGPWQVYSTITYATGASGSGWGIVNVSDGKHRHVGKPSKPGSRSKKNYYEVACEKARELNEQYRIRSMVDTAGYNRQDLREDIISTLNFCLTWPGATCYDMGVPGMVKRLEAINDEVGKTLEKLHKKDQQDFEYQGIISAWALMLQKGGDIDLRKP